MIYPEQGIQPVLGEKLLTNVLEKLLILSPSMMGSVLRMVSIVITFKDFQLTCTATEARQKLSRWELSALLKTQVQFLLYIQCDLVYYNVSILQCHCD